MKSECERHFLFLVLSNNSASLQPVCRRCRVTQRLLLLVASLCPQCSRKSALCHITEGSGASPSQVLAPPSTNVKRSNRFTRKLKPNQEAVNRGLISVISRDLPEVFSWCSAAPQNIRDNLGPIRSLEDLPSLPQPRSHASRLARAPQTVSPGCCG